MTTVIEKLRELLSRSNVSVVVEWHDNEWRHGGKHHITDELSALLDVAEAAKKVPGEWVQSVEFSGWIEAQIIVADLDEKLRPLLKELLPEEQEAQSEQ